MYARLQNVNGTQPGGLSARRGRCEEKRFQKPTTDFATMRNDNPTDEKFPRLCRERARGIFFSMETGRTTEAGAVRRFRAPQGDPGVTYVYRRRMARGLSTDALFRSVCQGQVRRRATFRPGAVA